MDNNEYEKTITKICYFSNVLFLLCHILYLFIFLSFKAMMLVYINCFSIGFYLLIFLLIKNRSLNLYSYSVAIEIAAYMTSATIICGFGFGFELCFIGLTILAFFASYFSKFGKKLIKPLPIGLGYMILYIFVFVITKFVNPYPYDFPLILKDVLYIAHSIVVFIFVLFFMYIITNYILRLEKNIIRESEIDKLTQVANRNALNGFFNNLGNEKNHYLAAIFDIDSFKQFNDVNGHLCGDYVLKEIARIAKENSDDDFVSRWGGEEFVVISKIEGDIGETVKKIDRIRKSIEEFEFVYERKVLHSTITVGVSEYYENDNLDQWILRADKKLYFGKNSGKNKTVF